MLEYERLRSLHVLVVSLFTCSLPLYFDPIDIDGALLPNCDVSRLALLVRREGSDASGP